MSEEKDTGNGMMLCCASCGVAEIDDIKLKKCTACYLVRYCSVNCQRDHRPKHKRACKKRAAELRDELLFKQPESSHLGDCPICCLPMPLDYNKRSINGCCSKEICRGCMYADIARMKESRLEYACPFCRKSVPSTYEERHQQLIKRAEANDPVAIRQEGCKQYEKGEYDRAFEYWTKAAKLGDADAHWRLAALYHRGESVLKDRGKKIYHLEEAAIGGHPEARYSLGCEEWNSGNNERAVKHWIIAANLGHDKSMKALMEEFKKGAVEKEDLAAALREHQAAVNATKSPQREVADEFYRSRAKK